MSRFFRRTRCVSVALVFLVAGGCGRERTTPPGRPSKPEAPAAAADRPAPTETPRRERPSAPAGQAPRQDPAKLHLKVVGVHDGDTLTGIDENKAQHKIRLDAIDAPELGQPYGQAAKKALSAKVFGKQVVVIPKTTDRYGRTIGQVVVDGRDVNRELIEEGMAWHYTQYDDDERRRDAERSARDAARGLWQGPDPEAPWDHRREQRQVRRAGAGK